MVSLGILGIVAGGILSALLYSQRIAASNLDQSYAAITAQSIIEQIVRQPVERLRQEGLAGIDIFMPFVEPDNSTSLRRTLIPFSDDPTVFTDIGPEGNAALGILVDAAYQANGNIIRPERYMPFRVNLSRQVEATESRVSFVLRYQWAVPDRKGADQTPIYLSGILTSFRSTAVSF